MPDKSFVTLEQHQCPVCLERFETGCLLLNKYLRNCFGKYTVTGHSFCPNHQRMLEEGYRFLVENTGTSERPVYTGRYAAIKKEVLEHLLPDVQVDTMAYATTELMNKLEEVGNGTEEAIPSANPS